MEIKGNSSKSWDRKGEEEAGISPRNSTLDTEEGEGDRGETLGSKRGETGEERCRLEKVRIWKKIGEKICGGLYLEGEENISSDMGEEICGEEREGKTGGGFANDSVTWSSSL